MKHCLSLALAFALIALPVSAQEAPEEALARTGPTDSMELEAFVDGLMEVMLDRYHSAGAVVSVVRDGEIFFAKGYGYADWEARTPVDPETTLFRIGSISKLFIWTSVMQMVEQGLLDLDVDVNQYLDFEIPPTFEKPVTLNDIMAHAAGFEDQVVELFGNEPEDVRPLAELLVEQLPQRVRPAGDISSYSNHATGMASYMVELATGTDWVTYNEENILAPLGMEYTSFRQPLPAGLAPHMSKGYRYSGGTYREEDFEYVPMAGVGAGAVAAADMARFMIAHLQLGEYGGQRILSEETARLMQTDHHRMAGGVNAMAHGFMVMDRNGERIIGHGGDTFWFHSNMALFPEYGLGVFVSFNSEDGGGATGRFVNAFIDRYFPTEEVVPVAPEGFAERADRFTGSFRANRFSHSTLAKLAALGEVTVRLTDEGSLRVLGAEWIEVAPLTFEERFGDRTLIFREDADGEITHLFLAHVPIVAFERPPAVEGSTLNLVLFGFAIAAIVITLLAPIIGWILRRWYSVRTYDLIRIPGPARLTLWLAAACFGTGLVVLAVALQRPDVIAVEPPTSLAVALLFPVLAIVPTLGSVWFTVRMWRKREGRPTVRVLYSGATVVFCLFILQLSLWNVLGWQY